MFDVRWSRRSAVTAVTVAAAVGLAACSSAPATNAARSTTGAHATASTSAGGTSAATPGGRSGAGSGAASAGTAPATPTAYTANQLRNALLTSVDGHRVASPVQSGAYGSLASVKASKLQSKGVKVTPTRCEQASVAGFNSASFAAVPATVATFRVGNDGISEVLLAPSASEASKALAAGVPAGCSVYHATVNGQTYTYRISQRKLSTPGQAARVTHITATGSSARSGTVDVWSVVYRAPRFVGAVTEVGPNASRAGAEKLAKSSYAKAAATLR